MDWIGSVSLVLGLSVTLLLILYEIRRSHLQTHPSVVGWLYTLSFLTVALSTFMLTLSLLTGQMHIAYVAMHTSHSLPWYYKLSAIWAGQNGSLLIWTFLLSLLNIIVWKIYRQEYPEWQRIINLVILISQVFFLSLNIWLNNPFDRLEIQTDNGSAPFVPADGQGLNPLLHHPAMIFHPPLLLLGYITSVVPFGIAVVGLWLKKNDLWFRWMRSWTLVSWSFLTAGIGLGAYWAYVELGWGGYWAWDPVENASLIPWLFSVALIHALVYRNQSGLFSTACMILAFGFHFFCVFGTFITRSGIISSVHAFSKSDIGIYLLIFLFLMLLVFGILFLRGKNAFRSETGIHSFFSNESLAVLLIITLVIYALAVLAGTIIPTIVEHIFQNRILLDSLFYNRLTRFISLILLVLLIIGQTIILGQHKRMPNYVITGIGFLLATLFFLFIQWHFNNWHLAFIAGLLFYSAYLLSAEYWPYWVKFINKNPVSSLVFWNFLFRKTGVYLAHLGFLFMYLGIAGSLSNQSYVMQGQQGQTFVFNGYEITIESFGTYRNVLYESIYGKLILRKNGEISDYLIPENRFYYNNRQTSTEVAIGGNLAANIYVSFTQFDEQKKIGSFQVAYHPLVPLLWIGILVMISVGVFILFSIRFERSNVS